MTFSCPNYDLKTESCQRLNTLCVAGRPGCVLHGKADFGEDIDLRIKRAKERAAVNRHRKVQADRTPK